MLLMKFVVQLIDLFPGFFERPFPCRRDPVEASPATLDVFEGRAQQAALLQTVQQRVQCAGADAVAVMLQFLHHRQAENRLMPGVQKHVDANQSIEEFTFLIGHKNHYNSAAPPVALTIIEFRYNFACR